MRTICAVFILFLAATILNCSKEDPSKFQRSNATYKEVDAEVGCLSKYSDEKKEDIFRSRYYNHWMTWSGEVVLVDADSASLNIDGKGIQDLQVDFANKKAGYDLTKGSYITVNFLMKTSGGCFLPFSGKYAIIVAKR